MTENQWPEDPTYRVPPATPGTTEERSPSTFPSAAQTAGTPQTGTPQTSGAYETSSRKDAVKQEAGDVARTAADSAQSVAQTAKSEAANVASEVKANAKDLLYQARNDLTQQAGTQQQKVADGLRSVSDQLHSMARASDQPGVASDLVRQAAERSSSVASWLEGRDPGSLLDEVKTFARQRPGTFLLLAAGAGVLAGRLTRSLSAGAPESTTGSAAGYTGQYSGNQYAAGQYEADQAAGYVPAGGGAVPPPPVQLPGPSTTTAGYDGGAPGSGYPAASTTASPLDSPQLVEEPWSGNRTAEDPLGDRALADDPMANDPLTRDRSADGQTGRP
ncbi:hypothetical protein F8G81_02730 [Arthrobacter sp. CDRTa11]|uniref:hypothetical protein n=1 Tax=Arthrobacter sp. CDRTa11 TaxID=2651199 RepID=UPI002265EBD2|nr:hypothetical protein [Arthrobacter sp. CDRTa11]UZX01658.1 hypothetical protein F8G81_02730 [Arthrobacter sp. CDRTa11]